MKIVKKILLILFSLFLIGIVFAVGYYFSATKEVSLSPEKLVFNEKTLLVYDGDGNALQSGVNSAVKQATPLGEIPLHVRNAFIDTEDRRFFKHGGYDLKGIARAFLHNIKSSSFEQGASTISQQLIKNTHLSQEKTLKRKLQEWKLTRALERKYAKNEILERYLNTIYFGHSCFGITAASEFYFGKTPAKLSIAEGAILAGLVKSPNNYSPFKNPEACSRRKKIVLNGMHACGSITEKEKNEALNAPLPASSPSKTDEGYLHFIFDELSSIAEKYSFKLGGKIEIFTYLDQALQQEVEKIADGYQNSDKTLLVLDGRNRGYKACVSTVGNIRRLPGSLIKPLLVYAPAIEEDILSPATPILDEKIDYNGYAPENYGNVYHGYVSARECVEKSLNIPAVKTLESLTVAKGASYLQKMGLPVEKEDESLALALGGMKNGYTLQDMLSAYSTLQNGGVFDACGFIASVKINDKTVYGKPTVEQRVFSEATAYLMTDILRTTAQNGTAKKMRTLPFPVAAKTGTVGTETGNTDAYALSYTALDCAAVWLGNADNAAINATGGGAPCNLLYQIHQALFDKYEQEGKTIPDFPICPSVQSVALDKASYYDTHTLSLADDISPENQRVYELFKSSAIPLNKSTSFSNPVIFPPTLSVKDGQAIIRFDKHSPKYYTYRIDRYDYATHTTLYEGEFIQQFTDDSLAKNKNYSYTVTPYYQGRAGTPITLPTLTTMEGESPKLSDKEILSKEWWEY